MINKHALITVSRYESKTAIARAHDDKFLMANFERLADYKEIAAI